MSLFTLSMKSTMAATLVFLSFSQTMAIAQSNDMSCEEGIQKLELALLTAKIKHKNAKENEGIYAKLAEDAGRSSNISVSLFAASSLVLGGSLAYGTFSTIGSAKASLTPVIDALMVNASKSTALAVIVSPLAFTVGGVGAGIYSMTALSNDIEEQKTKAADLVAANRNFDHAVELLNQQRGEIDLDYCQYTDFLGLRDKATTNKLLENVQQISEVEQLRVQHFEISLKAMRQACQ